MASLVPNLARAAFPYIKSAAAHRGRLRAWRCTTR